MIPFNPDRDGMSLMEEVASGISPRAGGPGPFDVFNDDTFVTGTQEQRARICLPFPVYIDQSISNTPVTIEIPEIPQWWVICVQTLADSDPSGTTGLRIVAEQNNGNKVTWSPGLFFVAGPLSVYGPIQRLIVFAAYRRITISLDDQLNGTTVSKLVGTVFAVSGGVDPSKVGLF